MVNMPFEVREIISDVSLFPSLKWSSNNQQLHQQINYPPLSKLHHTTQIIVGFLAKKRRGGGKRTIMEAYPYCGPMHFHSNFEGTMSKNLLNYTVEISMDYAQLCLVVKAKSRSTMTIWHFTPNHDLTNDSWEFSWYIWINSEKLDWSWFHCKLLVKKDDKTKIKLYYSQKQIVAFHFCCIWYVKYTITIQKL